MDKVHPLTEAVDKAIFEAQERDEDASAAAIRAVLTFEPGFSMQIDGNPVESVYAAMTAALLKEVENP
jgi:hypothetical protein